MPHRRRSRKEQQATTRSKLMRAAGRVFCRHGLEGASIDQVAADAGFTKGAFYANFRSKEELFLAMLDERFARRIATIDAVLASDSSDADVVQEGARDFREAVVGDPEWERLFFEFAAYAARNDAFREELVARWRTLVDRMGEGLALRARRAGMQPPESPQRLAKMICAAANGVALQSLLDPEESPADLFESLLQLLTAGVTALAEAEQAQATG